MNTQHKLSVMRPPRVQITYDVETLGSFEQKELPFVIGIIADLAGESKLLPFYQRRFTLIDGDNFDDVLAHIAPKLNITVEDEAITMQFTRFSDFLPDNIINMIPSIKELLAKRIALVDLASKLDGNAALEEALVNNNSDEAQKLINKPQAEMLINTFIEIAGSEKITNPYQFAIEKIASLDIDISVKLDKVLHNQNFKKLLSSWLGIRYLVLQTASSSKLKLKVLSASRKEIQDDLDRVASFDVSNIFKKVYEEEYGTPGGEPYSCLIIDEYFSKSNSDIEYVRKLAEIACASHAPLITGVSPEMFGLNSFKDLSKINAIHKIFESSEAAKFNGLRDSEESCYVSFAMPRVMLRAPYHRTDNPISSFRYNETIASDDDLCWGNAAYVVGGRIVEAYTLYGWTAAIRGVEGGGLIENLPTYIFKTEYGDTIMQCPTEIAITDRKERELSDLGFLPICHIKGTDKAVIFGAQTAQKPKLYISKDATANASISARLPYIMNCSRFAHYIKVMMRDKIGSAMSAANVEFFLQNWLGNYVLLSDEGSMEMKSELPLREGTVIVKDDEERPGSYRAILYLRPHFQLEDLEVSMRLVAKIPELVA